MVIIITFDSSTFKQKNKHLLILLIELIKLGYTDIGILQHLNKLTNTKVGKVTEFDVCLEHTLIPMLASYNHLDEYDDETEYERALDMLQVLIKQVYRMLVPHMQSLTSNALLTRKYSINNITSLGEDTVLHFIKNTM